MYVCLQYIPCLGLIRTTATWAGLEVLIESYAGWLRHGQHCQSIISTDKAVVGSHHMMHVRRHIADDAGGNSLLLLPYSYKEAAGGC